MHSDNREDRTLLTSKVDNTTDMNGGENAELNYVKLVDEQWRKTNRTVKVESSLLTYLYDYLVIFFWVLIKVY